MAIEISPSGRSLLIFGSMLVVLFWFLGTSGAIMTLLLIIPIVVIAAFILWAVTTRLARWGAGL